MQTPFRASPKTVLPEWIDFNGHLNMAYYSVLFDTSVDEAYEQIGFGPDYARDHRHTTYVAEFHICYVRELHEGDNVYVTTQLVDYDEKRFHTYQELYHADGWLAATAEALTLHVDMSGPRVAPMPANIQTRMAEILKAHNTLGTPERLNRSIGIKRK
ncbi:thioesterase family protein [Neptunicoccus cionae]|uniref:thioesterase family protein n=1 Tax=Neptunicoccus cionae TaxID=2035344 RepID=UPI000C78FEE6|nr:thioesterase family protein [Amylibacter cionae]PLS22394.1 thioesterase [Amylibacter cionae]